MSNSTTNEALSWKDTEIAEVLSRAEVEPEFENVKQAAVGRLLSIRDRCTKALITGIVVGAVGAGLLSAFVNLAARTFG